MLEYIVPVKEFIRDVDPWKASIVCPKCPRKYLLTSVLIIVIFLSFRKYIYIYSQVKRGIHSQDIAKILFLTLNLP